jgi:hypothetical protein
MTGAQNQMDDLRDEICSWPQAGGKIKENGWWFICLIKNKTCFLNKGKSTKTGAKI